jgi:hypothetical protein
MSVKLRVKFPARIVLVNGDGEIAGSAIPIRARQPDTSSRLVFQFRECFGNGSLVRRNKPTVAAHYSHNGNRLRSRDREVIEMSPMRLNFATRSGPVRTLALPQKLAAPGIESVAYCLKVFGSNFSRQPQ